MSFPNVQNTGLTSIQNQAAQQTGQTGALGSVGNLRFRGEPGATPRASGPGFFGSIKQGLSKLAFYLTASPQARAQRFVQDQRQDNRQMLGNLLGHLTGNKNDRGAMRAAAADLTRLADLVKGDLAGGLGGKDALRHALQGLGDLDLDALKDGVLSDPAKRSELLDVVTPSQRNAAIDVLDRLTESLDTREAGRVLGEPLDTVKDNMGLTGDGAALHEALGRLAEGLGDGPEGARMLADYLHDLPDDALSTFCLALSGDDGFRKMAELTSPDGSPKLSAEDRDQAQALITRLRTAVENEAQSRLDDVSASLGQQASRALEAGTDAAVVLAHCQNEARQATERLSHGSSNQVLLKALALPESMTGLTKPQAESLIRNVPDHQLPALHRSMTDMPAKTVSRVSGLLLQAMPEVAGRALDKLDKALASGDYNTAVNQLNVYRQSLGALQQLSAPPSVTGGLRLSDAQVQSLSGLGIAFDRDTLDTRFTLRDDSYDLVAPMLRQDIPGTKGGKPDPKQIFATKTIDVPQGEGDSATIVSLELDETLWKDGIQRPSVRLSVKGGDADGGKIDVSWPSGIAQDDQGARLAAMGQSVQALIDVAGKDTAMELMRIINQQLGASFEVMFMGLREDSPLRMADGTPVLVGGGATQSYTISQQEDGTFRVDAAFLFGEADTVRQITSTGVQEAWMAKGSWAEMSVSLVVNTADKTVKELPGSPPSVRYSLIQSDKR